MTGPDQRLPATSGPIYFDSSVAQDSRLVRGPFLSHS